MRGIIGKTHGVRSARSPPIKPNIKIQKSSEFSSCAEIPQSVSGFLASRLSTLMLFSILLVSFVDVETAVFSSLIASCEGISADSEFLPAMFCSNSKVFGARQTLSSQV